MVGFPELKRIATTGDPLEMGQDPVHVESDAVLIHAACRPELDSRPSPHLVPATFTWENLVAPLPE